MEFERLTSEPDVALVEPRRSGINPQADAVILIGDGMAGREHREVSVIVWGPAIARTIAMLLDAQLRIEQGTNPLRLGLAVESTAVTTESTMVRVTVRVPGGSVFPFQMDRALAAELLSQLAGVLAS